MLTDGVYEASSPAGAPFGIDRALGVAHSHRHKSAREIIDAVYDELRSWIEPRSHDDDVTMIVVKVDREAA